MGKRPQPRLRIDAQTGEWRNGEAGEGRGSELCEPGGLRHQAGGASWRAPSTITPANHWDCLRGWCGASGAYPCPRWSTTVVVLRPEPLITPLLTATAGRHALVAAARAVVRGGAERGGTGAGHRQGPDQAAEQGHQRPAAEVGRAGRPWERRQRPPTPGVWLVGRRLGTWIRSRQSPRPRSRSPHLGVSVSHSVDPELR